MKKLAAWSLWLDGCIWGVASALGTAQAAPPPDMVIASVDEARAFSGPEPFVFAGQSLSVLNSFSTERDIRLERLAPLIVGPGVQFEIQGRVSSPGQTLRAPLEKRGLGTLTLAGENSYTSNTVLREGALRLQGTSALGDSLYDLEQHGGTMLHLDAGARLENFIQLVETRPGDTPLPGLEGAVQWRVDAGTATLSNSINALLPMRKTGGGSLRLTGFLQGHSDLLVQAGALVVDSLAAARVAIADGARLEGQGELAHLRLHKGGMVAPGGRDRPATLSVWGNAVFEADSLYHVNAYPDGDADLLRVGGAAVLDGHVLAQAGDGDWAREHRYLILSADAGLNGTAFAGVDTDLAFLDPALEYDEHRVYLMLRRNDLDAGDIGETAQEKEVGDAITPPDRRPRPRPPRPPRETEPAPEADEPAIPGSELPDKAPVIQQEPLPLVPEHAVASVQPLTPLEEAVQGMSKEQLRSMLRLSSGSWHASVRSFLLEDGRHVRQALLASGRDTRRHSHILEGWHPHGAEDLRGSATQAGSAAGWRSWAQVYTAAGRRAAAAAVEGDRHHSRGIVLGLDAPAARHWRLGMALAAQHAQLKQDERQALAKVDSLHAGFSAHADWSGMRLTTALLRTWHRIDSRRRVSAGPLQELQRSTYAGRSWQAVMELAAHLRSLHDWGEWLRSGLNHTVEDGARPTAQPGHGHAPGWRMGPYLRHEWLHLSLPRHQESGGLMAHEVAASSTTMHATTLGWRLRHDWQGAGRRPSWLEADLGWRRVWGGARVSSSQRFLTGAEPGQPSPSFSSQGQPFARNALALTLEAGLAPRRNTRLALRYSGLAGRTYRDHAAWADLRWMF